MQKSKIRHGNQQLSISDIGKITDYQLICQRVSLHIDDYFITHHKKPNTLVLGFTYYNKLKVGTDLTINTDGYVPTFMGIRVYIDYYQCDTIKIGDLQ